MAYLYQLIFSNKKAYIGITTNAISKRYHQHKRAAKLGKSKLPVYEAWRKYGEPKLIILAEMDIACISIAEINAIRIYNTIAPHGYNLAYGGLIAPTKNPEVAKKLARALTGRKLSESHKQHMKEAHKTRTDYCKGFRHTSIAKQKISSAMLGNTRAKGKPKSEETKLKMSIAIKASLAKRKNSLTDGNA